MHRAHAAGMSKHPLLHAIAATLVISCAGSAHMSGSASVSAPDLVYVSPGVQVIADYREPIFYSDSYYWRYDGNIWYRSSNYTSGWVRYQAPVAVLRIEQPSAYAHYHGAVHASAGPTDRTPPPSSPAMTNEERKDVKDTQKEERKEQKAEQKEERNDQKAEQKEERKDQKEERKEQKAEQKDERKSEQRDAKKGRK